MSKQNRRPGKYIPSGVTPFSRTKWVAMGYVRMTVGLLKQRSCGANSVVCVV